MTTAEKIREVLIWTGVSQKELASRLDMAYPTLNAYLCERHSMTVHLLREIANALGVSLFLLLNEEPLPADWAELTEDERQTIRRYRLLTVEQKRFITQNMVMFLQQGQ